MSFVKGKEICPKVFVLDGREYQAWIILYEGREYVFSTKEFEDKLLTEEGNYTGPAARYIDEQIVYFLDEEEQQNMTYEALLEYAELRG